jgi:tetratricopeptide (TPR) repeat protein
MRILENLGRVMAAESILPTVDRAVDEEPASLLMLMVSADLHWRRKEWDRAITLAKRALEIRPRHSHALSILMNSYGHLGQWDAAYMYAPRLLQARHPNWTIVKLTYALFGVISLLTPKGLERYRRTMQRCEEEARSDRENLRLAQELVSKYGAANDAVAV